MLEEAYEAVDAIDKGDMDNAVSIKRRLDAMKQVYDAEIGRASCRERV